MPRMQIVRLLLVLLVLQGVGAFFSNEKVQTEIEQEFNRNFIGFREPDKGEFYSLIASHTEIPIALTVKENEDAGTMALHFSLREESAVYLSVSADSAEAVLVHPLILTREDGKLFLLPLIRSSVADRNVWNSIRLGRFAAGDHSFYLAPDPALNLPIPDSIQFSATRPSHDSQLATFIDHHPVVKVKNPANVLDDIPLMGYSHVYRRDAEYMVTSHLIFSSENGGTMPPGLMRSYQRTLDVEWVMKQIFKWDEGQMVASHWQFQGRNHTPRKFEGRRMLGNSPVLSVATPNNNFGDGRQLFGFLGPTDSAAETESLSYAPKPIFLPPGQWSQHLIDAYPELQLWSQFELAMERCIDTNNGDDPAVQKFLADLAWVRQHLTVVFPNRGCGDNLVQLPPHQPETETALHRAPGSSPGRQYNS